MVTSATRALFAVLIAVLAVTFTPLAKAQAAVATPVGSESKYSAIVIDAQSGEVLYAKRADSIRYPASITKVMTLYLTFEALASGQLSADEMITVSKHAASQGPTKLGLRAGSSIRVDDAIRAIAVQSANDMAVAMAERIGGTESRFTALMTLRAQELGMHNTRYVNANGLPDSRQVSTARDIAVLSRAVMRDFPQYYAYFSQKQFAYGGQVMNNHNRLLFQMAGVDGLKTGFTNSSGYNLAASGVRDGHRLIAVVLGGNSNASRDAHVEDLLNTGFEVMRRRDAGETILVAQNLFESEPAGLFAPSLAQGDADGPRVIADQGFSAPDDSTDVEDEAPAARPSRVQLAALPRIIEGTKAVAQSAAKPAGGYGVQVGAFKKQSDARAQLSLITKRFTQHFAEAEAVVGAKTGGFFKARFDGLTADAAKAACSALKAKRLACMVIAP